MATQITASATDDELRSLVWTPTDAQRNYIQWTKQSYERTNILLTSNAKLDSEILPLFPGQARIVCARPGGGKTTYSLATGVIPQARLYAKTGSKKACLIVTYDQTIEEIEGIINSQSGHTITDVAWGRVPVHIIEQSMEGRELLPIYYLGKSGVERRRKQPRMTVDNVYKAILMMEQEHDIEIQLLMVDFMQIIPIVGKASRADQVAESYALYHELLQELQAFGLLLSQAKREIETEKIKIPKLVHSEWSDSAGQFGHQFVGIWRPWTTEPPSMPCPLVQRHEVNGRCWFCLNKQLVPMIEVYYGGGIQKMPVAANLMVTQYSKHRFEEPNKTFYQFFDTRLVRLAEIEWTRYKQGQIPEYA